MNIDFKGSGDLDLLRQAGLDRKLRESRPKSQEDRELREAAQEFESIFLYMMMKEMKKTLPDNQLVEKSQGSLIFEDMYMEELAKEISQGENGLGLAREIYQQLKSENTVKAADLKIKP